MLIEIRVPDDIDRSPWAKQFREHLTSLNQPQKEAMFDFVLVCNVLRVKESEVKQVARSMKWRLTELNKDRRDSSEESAQNDATTYDGFHSSANIFNNK